MSSCNAMACLANPTNDVVDIDPKGASSPEGTLERAVVREVGDKIGLTRCGVGVPNWQNVGVN